MPSGIDVAAEISSRLLASRLSTFGYAVNAATLTELETFRTDESLVLAARAGDASAKEALFRRHARSASDLGYRLLGRDDELEDVVQESFLAVFEQLSRLADPRAFKTWLAVIVTRAAIKILRRRRFLSRLGFVQAERIQIEDILANDAPPDVRAELERVYRAISSLPTIERVVLVSRRIEQLQLEEIAQRTGLSLATVKRRLARAERRLTKDEPGAGGTR